MMHVNYYTIEIIDWCINNNLWLVPTRSVSYNISFLFLFYFFFKFSVDCVCISGDDVKNVVILCNRRAVIRNFPRL